MKSSRKYGAATWGYPKEEALKHINEVVQMVVEELIEEGVLIPTESHAKDVAVLDDSRVAVTVPHAH